MPDIKCSRCGQTKAAFERPPFPGAIGQRIGPTDRRWFGPSVDLTVHMLGDCRSQWVLAHNTARWAGDGYASVDMALWDLCGKALGKPVHELLGGATRQSITPYASLQPTLMNSFWLWPSSKWLNQSWVMN